MNSKNDYLSFLFKLVDATCVIEDQNNMIPIMALFTTPYRVRRVNDQNRIFDAHKNREAYINLYGVRDHVPVWLDEDPISVLEVFIALAVRVGEEIISSSTDRYASGELFEAMFYNMPIHNISMDETYFNVERFVKGHMDINGYGGPFPLRHVNEDQRKVELWSSMSSYLTENYDEHGLKL